jgi:hypothetical protein
MVSFMEYICLRIPPLGRVLSLTAVLEHSLIYGLLGGALLLAFVFLPPRHSVKRYAAITNFDPRFPPIMPDSLLSHLADGRWYVEDNWGSDAPGAEKVWNPCDPDAGEPHFFGSQKEAITHAVSVVARVSGVPESKISI